MGADDRENRRQLYISLMHEIRLRIDSIWMIEGQLGKSLNKLPHLIANETYLLQLRMVFESIALGCMVVHGDIPMTRSGKLAKFYQADALLKGLSKVHPEFFPTPVQHIHTDPRHPNSHIIGPRVRSGCLTKGDIIRLYGKCGEYLHRGTRSTFAIQSHEALKLGKEIGDTARSCVALLKVHTISLRDTTDVLACVFHPQLQVGFLKKES